MLTIATPPPAPLDMRLVGPRTVCGGEEKNPNTLTMNRTLVIQSVTD
jgi:hypothetical protein